MPTRRGREQHQVAPLVPFSTQPTIPVPAHHPYAVATGRMPWEMLMGVAQRVREGKLKSNAGRPPHLRALVGVVALMALRKQPLREVEDHLRYYAPARLLCGLTETDWTPDFTTIHDFLKLMGEDGLRQLNVELVKLGVAQGVADPAVVAADLTAQEAAIPYPNEMGLMNGFMDKVSKLAGRTGRVLKSIKKKVQQMAREGFLLFRKHRFFADTAAQRHALLAEMAAHTQKFHSVLATALKKVTATGRLARMKGRHAVRRMQELNDIMRALLPQIRYWMKTGQVAAGKIISLTMPQLYSIIRGKVGKQVEFGLTWGLVRLRGGLLLATLARQRKDIVDARFVRQSLDNHIKLFGAPPESYSYDRGGYSKENIATLKEKGVRDVALAPRGKAKWLVSPAKQRELVRERIYLEGNIGVIKSQKFGFNKPAARSVEMMGVCGQRAVLGHNLTTMVKRWMTGMVEMPAIG